MPLGKKQQRLFCSTVLLFNYSHSPHASLKEILKKSFYPKKSSDFLFTGS